MRKPSGAARNEHRDIVPSLRTGLRLGLAASAIGVGWLFLGAAPAATAAEPAPSGGLLSSVTSAVDAVQAPVSSVVSGAQNVVAAATPAPAPAPVPAPAPAPRPAPVAAVVAPVVDVVKPVTSAVTQTVRDVAADRPVGAIVTPVADAADDLITSVPVLDPLLDSATIGSIVDPVTTVVDETVIDIADAAAGSLVVPGAGVLTPGTNVPGLSAGVALEGLLGTDAAGVAVDSTLAERLAIGTSGSTSSPNSTAAGRISSAPAAISVAAGGEVGTALPPIPSAPVEPLAPAPNAPSGSSSSASGQPLSGGANAALTSGFSITLASGIRSSDESAAATFYLASEPGSSPD